MVHYGTILLLAGLVGSSNPEVIVNFRRIFTRGYLPIHRAGFPPWHPARKPASDPVFTGLQTATDCHTGTQPLAIMGKRKVTPLG